MLAKKGGFFFNIQVAMLDNELTDKGELFAISHLAQKLLWSYTDLDTMIPHANPKVHDLVMVVWLHIISHKEEIT